MSCGPKEIKGIDLSEVEYTDIAIKRYEKALFGIHHDSLVVSLNALQGSYPFFIGETLDTFDIKSIRNFIFDPVLIKAAEDIETIYPELNSIEASLNKALKYLRYHEPVVDIKNIYTYISGFDFESPIHYVDSVLIIGLDMYLGSDYYFYPMLGLPRYMAYSYTADYIVRDCMEEIARSIFPERLPGQTFLDKMLYEGKMLYFLDCTMPHTEDTIKVVYSTSQFEWCQRNEANIWGFFIDQQFLHEKGRKLINRFMQKGPSTPSFAPESPARTGSWIGWQIVRSYMQRHPDTSLRELFEMRDSQKFLNDSAYKPRKPKRNRVS